MPYAYGDYILARARLHANPSDWIEKRPFLNGLFSWHPQRESNPQLALRRGLLYPFNYAGVLEVFYTNEGVLSTAY